ncbi:hypothetical protein K493DRAFT_313349, partial [Basidiobolus meristosporus CBS 931.73]
MDFRKVRRWVSNPFGSNPEKSRFYKARRANTDERRRNTICLDSRPIADRGSVDLPRPAPIIIPNPTLIPFNEAISRSSTSSSHQSPLATPTPTAPPNSPVDNLEHIFQLPISSQSHLENPSRTHGYKTKFSGKLKRMKGMLTGDWEMQLRGEMQLLDGEAEITAYRLLKHGYQPNEIVCG